MKILKDLFTEREELYVDYTNAVLDVLDQTVLEATYEVLSVDPDTVEWQDVQLIDDIILLIATIIYSPGDVVVLKTGEQVTLDENNYESYQRIIRIGISLELASTGTKADIIDFLRKSQTTGDSDDDISDDIESSTVGGFSTENLSEDQIRQLSILQRTNTGGKTH